MLALGSLAFASPWLLAALAALPVIWWLLRVTPPAPRRIVFPAIRLLLGLTPREEMPARTPWWLILLRTVLAALVVLALAHPLLNPQTRLAGSGPIALVIDDGWAAARDWSRRQTAAIGVLAAAAGAGGGCQGGGAGAAAEALAERPRDGAETAGSDAAATRECGSLDRRWRRRRWRRAASRIPRSPGRAALCRGSRGRDATPDSRERVCERAGGTGCLGGCAFAAGVGPASDDGAGERRGRRAAGA